MIAFGPGSHNAEKWAHRLTTADCASYRLRDLLAPGRLLPKFDDGTRSIPIDRLGPPPSPGSLGRVFFDRFATARPLPTTVGVWPVRQRFGGVRWLLVCPTCGRRAGKLYTHASFGANCLRCRRCGDLTYRSRRADDMVRLSDGAARLEHRLNMHILFDGVSSRIPPKPGDYTVHPLPGKPKGMHWSTFRRLRDKLFEYDERQMVLIGTRFDSFIEHHGSPVLRRRR